MWEYLERAVADGSDMEAREHMHNASCLAGIAFSNASLGICHSLAHALGAHFHIPHGRANALLLTHIIGYNAGLELVEDSETLLRYEKIANMLGIGGGTPKAAVYGLIRQIKNLMQRIHIPAYVTDLSVDREAFETAIPEMAGRAMEDNCTVTNPRTPSQTELENLYKNLCKGGPV